MSEPSGNDEVQPPMDSELPEEAVALIEAGERDGCVTLSEVESLVVSQELGEDVVEGLYEELDRRGIEVTDACVRDGAGESDYSNGDLAAATTDSLQLFLNEIGR